MFCGGQPLNLFAKEHGVRSSKVALRCLSGLTAAFELD